MNKAQLKMFWSRWPHVVLTAISPDDGRTETQCFTRTDKKYGEFLAWVKRQNEALRWNVYFTVNPVQRKIRKKASRVDISALAFIHCDVDMRAGPDIDRDAERARILTLLQNHTPTAIIDSGNGYQAFYRLRDAIPLDGTVSDADDKALYNKALELALGGDNCSDVSRVMRLPGTTNWPNAQKKAKGRVPVPAEWVEYHDDRLYPISDFKKARPTADAAAVVEIDTSNVKRLNDVNDLGPKVSDLCKVVIVQGTDPDKPERFPSRSEALFFVCCELARADLGNDEIYSIISDPEFKISASVLDKGSGQESYAARQIERARERNAAPDWVSKLNHHHAIIKNYGGKCVVFIERDGQVTHQGRGEFIAANARSRVKIGTNAQGGDVTETLGKAWFYHKAAREYEQAIFLPGKDTEDNTYNLFRGWTVQPKPGKCTLFLNYVHDIVCGGDNEHYKWLIDWTAHMFKRPWQPPEAAVVLRGGQGVGKGFFPDRLGDLLGPYYTPVNTQRSLLGNFNIHLKNAILVFADETWGTAKREMQGPLKALITQPYILIEPKGVDIMRCEKYLRLIMASNLSWAIPADMDDRRFFVKDVFHPLQDDENAKFEYFRAITAEWENGGKEAFLAELLDRDISGFNHRFRPITAELTKQKTYTFVGPRRLAYDLLQNGALPCHGLDKERFFVATRLLAEQYNFESRHYTAIGRELRAIADTNSTREVVEGNQVAGYWLPQNLIKCRENWACYHKLPIDWSDEVDEFEWVKKGPVPF